MEMPCLKTGRDAARRRFWLAMSGFVMALALMPFSYKVERRLETAAHIKGGESEKVTLELAQRFQSPYAASPGCSDQRYSRSGFSRERRCIGLLNQFIA